MEVEEDPPQDCPQLPRGRKSETGPGGTGGFKPRADEGRRLLVPEKQLSRGLFREWQVGFLSLGH